MFADPSFYLLPSTILIVAGIVILSMAIFAKNLAMETLGWVQSRTGVQYIINGIKLKYPTTFKTQKLLGETFLLSIRRYLAWTKVR